MLPPKLVHIGLALLLALPLAAAGAPNCAGPETACVGGNQSSEGQGTCPGESERYHFIVGYEGTRTGSYMLAGVGTMCEGDETRQGLFLVGAPAPAFAGVYENDAHCGAEAGAILFMSFEQPQRDDAITCMLM